jgi:hypothetical protein
MDLARRALYALVFVSGLASCGGGGDDSSPPASPPPPVGIGAAGGTVTGPNGAQVVVPAGAMTANTVIEIAEAPSGFPALPASMTLAGSVYAFTPHGTTFAQPATITVPFNPASVPAGATPVLMKTANGAAGPWEPVAGATVSGSAMRGNVASFSFGAVTIPATVTPTIVTQPQSISVMAGATATFTVTAGGPGSPYSYLWQRSNDAGVNWSNISGSNAATYSVASPQPMDSGARFRVRVGTAFCRLPDADCSVLSSEAILTVTSSIVIAQPPQSVTVAAGQTATFAVAATGSGTLAYQWQRSNNAGSTWTSIAGATGATYVLPNVALTDHLAQFRVALTDAASSTFSTPATLRVTGVAFGFRQLGTAGLELGKAVAVDAGGAPVLVGFTTGVFQGQSKIGQTDAFVVRLNLDGSTAWVRQVGPATPPAFGGRERSATFNAVAVDSRGAVYAGGFAGGRFPGQVADVDDPALLARFDTAGNLLWQRAFGPAAASAPVTSINALVVTSDGGVVAGGRVSAGALEAGQVASGLGDAFIVKYDAAGNRLWTRQFGTAAPDVLVALAQDAAGNIYAALSTEGTFAGQTRAGDVDVAIAKFGSDGALQWLRQHGTPVSDAPLSIAVDGAGANVYVGGFTDGSWSGGSATGRFDAFIVQLDAAGALLRSTQFASGSGATNEVRGLAVDASGAVLAAGLASGLLAGQAAGNDAGFFIARFNAALTREWLFQTRAAGGTGDSAWAIAPAPGNRFFVTGHTSGALPQNSSSGLNDAWVGRFDVTSGLLD